MFHRIVVAYNGSHEAERALHSAIRLAKSVHAELHAITVTTPAPTRDAYAAAIDLSLPSSLKEDQKKLTQELQEKARAIARDEGMPISSHTAEGRDTVAILGFLRDHKADLLVIGLHPHDSYLSRLWSTVYGLAQDAPCSVLGVH